MTTSRSQEAPAGVADDSHGSALVATLVIVVVVVSLVSSLGAPLLPLIGTEHSVSDVAAQWTLTIALLSGAVACPVLGRLGDGPQRRRVILLTLGAVTLGCALAVPRGDFWLLLVGRALQGLGLGLMPLAMAVARDHLPAWRQRSAVVLLSITTVAGAGFGYPISGSLAAVGGLAASFIFGVVVSLTALVLAALVIPRSDHLPRARLDRGGALLLGLGVAALLIAVSEVGAVGWSSPVIIGLLVGGVVVLVGWSVLETRIDSPLVELRLLRHRAVFVADATAIAAGAGIYLLMSTVSWLLQTPGHGDGVGFGQSPFVAAMAMVPFAVSSVLTTQVLLRVFGGVDEAWLMPIGCFVFALSMAGLAFMRSDMWMVFVVMAVGGAGAGCTFSAMPRMIVASVPRTEVGSAIGFNQVLRLIGYASGSAVAAGLLGAFAGADGRTTAQGYDSAALIGVVVFGSAAIANAALAALPRASQRRARANVDLVSSPDP